MQHNSLWINFNHPQYYNCPICRNHEISHFLQCTKIKKKGNRIKGNPRNIYPLGNQKEDLK